MSGTETTLEMRRTIEDWHPIIQDIVMRDWVNLLQRGIANQKFEDGKWTFWLN